MRARKESLVKAAAERAAAAEEAAAESEVETDIGSTTEAENTESEVDSETESAADNRRSVPAAPPPLQLNLRSRLIGQNRPRFRPILDLFLTD